MERVLGIGGYFLRAADPAALTAWYRDCLGLDIDANGLWNPQAGPTVFAAFESETDYFGSRDVQIMSYEEGKTYRYNPFDITKVWPHADFPLIKVGHYTLNRNPQNFFAEIEQAAFSPSNLVPGIDISPDKMLMARVFAYPDAQRARIGTNYNQLPVNTPHAAKVTTYQHEGNMQFSYNDASARVYTPNSYGGPAADPALAGSGGWETDGELVRAAQTLRSADDDFGQAGTLYRDVFSQESKDRFLQTLTGQYRNLTVDRIKERFLWYWTQVDAGLGDRLRAEIAKPTETPNEAADPVGVGH